MFVPHVPPSTPSLRAQELGRRLAAEIDRFRRSYPDATAGDVRSALQLAAHEADTARPLRLLVLLGLAALGGGLWLAFRSQGARGGADGVIWIAGTLAILVVAALLVLVRRQ